MGAEGRNFDGGLLIRVVYGLCLFGATAVHALTIIRHGLFWDYGGVVWPSAVYWTSLTLLDPLAALLLFFRPRLGVILTAAIIVTDVAHNLWFVLHKGEFGGRRLWLIANSPFLAQVAFLIFVAATIRWSIPTRARTQRGRRRSRSGSGARSTSKSEPAFRRSDIRSWSSRRLPY
jgi:hypothetical protein